MIIDGHCHYTGSLSDGFFNNKSNSSKRIYLTNKNNWQYNYKKFFEIYKNRQSISKKNDDKYDTNYKLGAVDIASSYYFEGVNQFQLRVGPKKNIDDTISRLYSMNEGFQIVEDTHKIKNLSKLVLTFIQDENGQFVNYADEVLDFLFKSIYDNKKLTSRIIGFDFSGPESNRNWKSICSIISFLKVFNVNLYKKNGHHVEIMLHIGEYVDSHNWQIIMQEIENFIRLGVDRISHGTILWLGPEIINVQEQSDIKKMQEILLEHIANKKIVLEICPSANFLLSPLNGYADIPLKKLAKKGVLFTINTDNKSIFKTTLQKEYKLVNFPLSFPTHTPHNQNVRI